MCYYAAYNQKNSHGSFSRFLLRMRKIPTENKNKRLPSHYEVMHDNVGITVMCLPYIRNPPTFYYLHSHRKRFFGPKTLRIVKLCRNEQEAAG